MSPGAVPPAPRRALLRAALALLCVTLVAADVHKRAEMSPVPFRMGSRYGRSPDRLMPRNDRFVMGSRYGKRSEGGVGGAAAAACLPGGAAAAACLPGGAAAPCRRVVCQYAPLEGLYKCKHLHYRDPLDSPRRAGEAGRGGE